MTDAVVVTNLTKTFRRHRPDRPWTIQEAIASGLRGLGRPERFQALSNISLRVKAGRTVGIIGTNGSGKSTLLRLIGGVGRPDSGRIEVRGRIGALLDLGVGFHADLTGRENTLLAGLLSGLSRREVLERLDAIVAFAEVEKFIDHPMRTYSTGMQMRLAFSTAVHSDPEILLIDEVLSVGDAGFQRKCLERIAGFKAAGCSILLVSHESSVVESLCDEVIWLNRGTLMAQGEARSVVREYLAFVHGKQELAAEPEIPGRPPAVVRTEQGAHVPVDEQRFGSVEVEIDGAAVVDQAGQPIDSLAAGQPLRLEIAFTAARRVVAPLFRVRILREDGLVCCDLAPQASPFGLAAVEGPGKVSVAIERLDVNSGRYLVDVGCYAQDWAYAYDYRPAVCAFIVRGSAAKDALLDAPHRWEAAETAPLGTPR